jgi:hypothetical protein
MSWNSSIQLSEDEIRQLSEDEIRQLSEDEIHCELRVTGSGFRKDPLPATRNPQL